ncbi:MAG: Uma2 family endonuclease [Planctomycetota bacterium]|nr:Uma2 family endonuclease [Planctomycetota bacterium]
MSSLAATTSASISLPRKQAVPPLQNGDRLTREQYMRRYESMPEVKKAERIEGKVYMPSPVNQEYHSGPHTDIVTWIGVYRAHTPGVDTGDNATVHLDTDNDPQPDALLFIKPECGGQVSVNEDGYLVGAPDLIVEVAASSVNYDLHEKLNVYRRNGVSEYLVWRVLDEALDWFILVAGEYVKLDHDEAGVYRSHVFPGLWLDSPALIQRDLAAVLKSLTAGLEDSSHAEFVSSLNKAGSEAS